METALTLKTLARLSASGAIIVLPTLAYSFSASDDVSRSFSVDGTGCIFNAQVRSSNGFAAVWINAGSTIQVSGGAYHEADGSIRTTYSPISATELAGCLDTDVSNISNFTQTGAVTSFDE